MSRFQLRQMNDWQVSQFAFSTRRVIDPDHPYLSLRITTTAKVWEVREKEKSPIGTVLWTAFATAERLDDGGRDRTTHAQAWKQAKHLLEFGGAKAAKQAAKDQAEAEANKLLTLADVMPTWWRRKVAHRSAETRKSYRAYIKSIETDSVTGKPNPIWTIPLATMRHKDINCWQDTVAHIPVQANQALKLMKRICKFALGEDMIDRDPAAGHAPLERKHPPKQTIIEPEEHDILRPAVVASRNKAKDALLLIMDFGCRTANACRIEPHEIIADPDNPKGRIWTIPPSKLKADTDEDFEYFLTAEQTVYAQNAAQWAVKPKVRKRHDVPLEDLIFDAKRNAIKYLYRSLIKKLGIQDSGPHSLRRLFGTDADEAAGPVAAQIGLGHKQLSTTENHYLKRRRKRRRAVADAVAKFRKERS